MFSLQFDLNLRVIFEEHLTSVLIFVFCLFQALSGFLIMMTQNGKLLYISDNAAEYLGHSMVSVVKVSSCF